MLLVFSGAFYSFLMISKNDPTHVRRELEFSETPLLLLVAIWKTNWLCGGSNHVEFWKWIAEQDCWNAAKGTEIGVVRNFGGFHYLHCCGMGLSKISVPSWFEWRLCRLGAAFSAQWQSVVVSCAREPWCGAWLGLSSTASPNLLSFTVGKLQVTRLNFLSKLLRPDYVHQSFLYCVDMLNEDCQLGNQIFRIAFFRCCDSAKVWDSECEGETSPSSDCYDGWKMAHFRCRIWK